MIGVPRILKNLGPCSLVFPHLRQEQTPLNSPERVQILITSLRMARGVITSCSSVISSVVGKIYDSSVCFV